jgi:hypothetical protein
MPAFTTSFRVFPEYLCIDCGRDTLGIDEYYMVTDSVWGDATPFDEGGMLCIECLELRLGRILVQADFMDCPVNSGSVFEQSPRLKARLDNLVCTVYPLLAHLVTVNLPLAISLGPLTYGARKWPLTAADASDYFTNQTSHVSQE